MTRRFFWIVVPLALAGCDPGAEPVDDPSGTTDPTSSPSATPAPTATAATATPGARRVSEETDLFQFEYSYPQKAGEVPALAAWLDRRLDRERQALSVEAERGRSEARDDGFPFNKYSSETEWEVIADLPRWLSMSASLSSYSGGAHPNYGFDTMVWDKETDRALEPMAFFTSAAALDDALDERLCEALNAERAERRGAPVEPAENDTFTACVSVDETNLLLGSRGGEKFDRIGIQIAPYIAGPYAEGTYEFTFDMTPELLETVRPEFREAFAARN